MTGTDWTAADALARAVLEAREGVAHLQHFLAAGLSRHQVAALFRRGVLLRPRIGWYCDPALPYDAVRAVRVGGVLGGVSAARSWGLPVPHGLGDDLHVSLTDTSSRLRHSRDRTWHVAADDEPGIRRHWLRPLLPARGPRAAVVDTLLQLAGCVPFEWLVAAIDAALHTPRDRRALLDGEGWRLLTRALPERLRAAWMLADGRAESPIETLLRLALVAAGLPFDIQVWAVPWHRVDFLLGLRLVVEVDGMANHKTEEQIEADRQRDGVLALWGYRVLRFTYRQITEDLPWVLDVIRAALEQEEEASRIRTVSRRGGVSGR